LYNTEPVNVKKSETESTDVENGGINTLALQNRPIWGYSLRKIFTYGKWLKIYFSMGNLFADMSGFIV